jgi:hypothetical protein
VGEDPQLVSDEQQDKGQQDAAGDAEEFHGGGL